MRHYFLGIGLGIFILLIAQSCSSDANNASELVISNEQFEIIANPFAISEEEAISKAHELTDKIIVSEKIEGLRKEIITGNAINTRSFGQRNNLQASVSAKNYNVKIEVASSTKKEVRQANPEIVFKFSNLS